MSTEITQRRDAAIDAARKAREKMQLAAEYLETDAVCFVGEQSIKVNLIVARLRQDAAMLQFWLKDVGIL
jgi:hypothetical protein